MKIRWNVLVDMLLYEPMDNVLQMITALWNITHMRIMKNKKNLQCHENVLKNG
jgi:hypothetical protein